MKLINFKKNNNYIEELKLNPMQVEMLKTELKNLGSEFHFVCYDLENRAPLIRVFRNIEGSPIFRAMSKFQTIINVARFNIHPTLSECLVPILKEYECHEYNFNVDETRVCIFQPGDVSEVN